MSLTYNQVRELILKTLEERPAGTKVEVPNQQNYELALLEYFQQLETTMSTSLVGIATAETTPIEPPQARIAYLAQQASSTTTVFENFMDGEGNPITITTDVDHVAFITLFWNTQYWSYQAVMIPVIYPGGDVLTKDVVSELPETGKENVVYLIVDPKDPTAYTMHMWLNGAWATVGGAMGAVRYDQVQELTHDQENLALSNLGLDVFVMDYSQVGNALPKEKVEQLIASHAVVLNGAPNEMPRLYTRGASDSTYQNFYATGSSSTVWTLTVNKTNYNVGTPRSNPSGTPGLQSLIITVIPPVLAGDPYELGMTNKEFANALKTYNPAKQVLVVLESNTGDPDTRGNIYYPKVSRYYVAGSFYVAMVYNAISHATNVDDLILYRDVSINYDESNDRLKISDKSANLYVDTVRYGVQNLTPDQQAQARSNIGAISKEDLPTPVEIVQEPGDSTTAVMSQKAVSDELALRPLSSTVNSQLSALKTEVEAYTDSGISAHNTSDTSHIDIRTLLNKCVGIPTYDEATHVITFTTVDGATGKIDLPIEELGLRYNTEAKAIEFTNADGSITSIPVEDFVKEYVGSVGDAIQITIGGGNEIQATLLNHAVSWDNLALALQERLNTYVTDTDLDTSVVRVDKSQTLDVAQQTQASANIGLNLVDVTDVIMAGGTMDNATFEMVRNAKCLYLNVDGMTCYFNRTPFGPSVSEDRVYWASAVTSLESMPEAGDMPLQFIIMELTISEKKLTASTFQGILGPGAISTLVTDNNFLNQLKAVRYTTQSLTTDQQDQASSNIGTRQVILTDADFESLTDARFTLLQNALRVVYTSDGITVVCDRTELDTSGETITWVSAPIAAREPLIKEGGFIQTDYIAIGLDTKTKALSLALAYGYDQGAIRFDVSQRLLPGQKVQALKNIGLDYVIIKVTNGTATLTQDQEDAMIAARGVLITGSVGYEPATRRVYTLGQVDGNIISGYSLLSESLLLTLSYNKTTKVLTVNSAAQRLIDRDAVRFNTAQSLNEDQQAQARQNIGIDQAFTTAIANNLDFAAALANNSSFITDLVSALDRDHYGAHLAVGADLQQGLLNDADFIAELKTKLGLT